MNIYFLTGPVQDSYGRAVVLDSRRSGRGFEPHRLHCVVSLNKTY